MTEMPPATYLPADALGYLPETPSQTAGPYVHIGLIPHQVGIDALDQALGQVMVGPDTKGERIVIEGRVFDGLGDPCREVLLEIWQANAAGAYDSAADTTGRPLDPTFRGWGRSGTDFGTGLYRFQTIKPGAVPGRHGKPMAPHISVWLVSRGMNNGLSTRIYFADEATANAADPVLTLIEPSRRHTLIARREERGGTDGTTPSVAYVFDIRLQGADETVFFDA